MPAARYGQFWSQMPAFALPAYYDGRVRINLRGREACGTVAADHYDGTCEEMIRLIRDCRDLLTGQPAVAEIHRPKRDPHAVGPSEADLYVVWKSAPLGFTTPRHGNIGPVPYRRTGGHTGSRGFLYMAGAGIAPGEAGAISSFDVIPTVVDLLGEARPAGMSGVSAAARLS
jgi:predicted AlkP superfamily phosphohydrolase/phosphomutase